MAKAKNHKIEISEFGRVVLVTILFLLLFLMALSFDAVASPVSKVTGIPKDDIKNLVSRTFGAVAGIAAIVLGFTMVGLPVVGAIAMVIGIVALAMWWKMKNQPSNLRLM